MPHKCTNCGRTFADGSKEMLSGCPDCGGNKFQFQPSGSAPSPGETKASTTGSNPKAAAATTDNSTVTDDSTATDTRSETGAVSRATSTVKGWVGSRNRSESPDSSANERQQGQPEHEQKPSQPSTSARSTPPQKSPVSPSDSPADSPADSPPDSPADPPSDSPADSNEDRAQASARSEIVPEDELPERPGDDGTGTVIKPPEDDDQPSLDELREELNSQFESIKVVEPGQYELNLMELYERDEYIIAMRENGRYVIQVPDSWTGPVDS
ncbi:OapC/ArvC family zinc-ribbon domain-containing protein [Haladaptatus sp.]|uniref:OapC/ArvC family zinc-ribbon domain-containing protein n=1 Tax=Haladaptatus sp. TaxID=1973141 RepID=UPI003C4122A2